LFLDEIGDLPMPAQDRFSACVNRRRQVRELVALSSDKA
jgi:DNA-binding NtrC family response regulator